MSNEGATEDGTGKGFAGLSSLVSDVDEEVASALETAAGRPGPSQVGDGVASTATAPPRATSAQPAAGTPYQQPGSPSAINSLSGAKWLLGIGAVIGAIWLLSSGSNQQPAPRPSVVASAPTGLRSAIVETPQYTPPLPPTRLAEEMPPVGTNNVLSYAQLRYCLSEDIRLRAAKSAVNGYNEFDVDRFNSMVTDYNIRCGQFRYRRGSLESVRAEVETNRSSLEVQGRARFQARMDSNGSGGAQNERNSRTVPRVASYSFIPDPPQSGYGTDPAVNPPTTTLPRATQSGTTVQREDRLNASLSDLSSPERQSIESACQTDKLMNGPAAYSKCLERQLSAMAGQGSRPDLSHLSNEERQSIESACSTDRLMNGPAPYNNCLRRQLSAMAGQAARPDLSHLSSAELQSIESACTTDKLMNGPAPYNNCLRRQLSAMAGQAGRPDLSHLSSAELQSIESACSTDRLMNGPAPYNNCLRRQLSAMAGQAGRPDLSRLSSAELQSIESACSTDRLMNGPAAYNSCLVAKLSSLRN